MYYIILVSNQQHGANVDFYFNKIDHVLDYRIHYRFNNQEYHYSLLNDNPYDVLKSDELEN